MTFFNLYFSTMFLFFFFFSSRRRHTRCYRDWSSDVCSSDLRRILDGPFEWAGVKSKYFFVAALAVEENQPRFGAAIVEGGPRTASASSLFGRAAVAPRAAVAGTLPVPPAGEFAYQVYVGPLEYRRLSQLGHDLDDANPYGGFLQPIIQPVSVLVVNILIWMHDQLRLAYGWV